MATWAGSNWGCLAFWGSRVCIHWGLHLNTTQCAWLPFSSVTFPTTQALLPASVPVTHLQFLPLPVPRHHGSLMSKVIFGMSIMQKRALFLSASNVNVKCSQSQRNHCPQSTHLSSADISVTGFAIIENIIKLLNRDGVKVLCSYAREVWEIADLFWRMLWKSSRFLSCSN